MSLLRTLTISLQEQVQKKLNQTHVSSCNCFFLKPILPLRSSIGLLHDRVILNISMRNELAAFTITMDPSYLIHHLPLPGLSKLWVGCCSICFFLLSLLGLSGYLFLCRDTGVDIGGVVEIEFANPWFREACLFPSSQDWVLAVSTGDVRCGCFLNSVPFTILLDLALDISHLF